MIRKAMVLAIAIGFVILLAGGVSADSTSTSQEYEFKEGVTIDIGAEAESDALTEAETMAEEMPLVDIPSNAAYMYTNDQRYIVVSDSEIQTGASDVSGVTATLENGDGIIFADEVETETEGQRVPYEEVAENTDIWHGEVVRFTIDYGQVAIATEAGQGAIQGQSVLGGQSRGMDILPPGESGVLAANLTTENSEIDDSILSDRFEPSGQLPLLSIDEEAYWIDEEVTLDVAIVSEGPMRGAHIVDRSFDSQNVDQISEIQSGEYDGELVTVEADTAESRVSTAETLQRALPCGQDMFYVGVACLPAVTDAVVHNGVMYDSQQPSQEDLLLYTAISNAQQNQPVSAQHRRVRVTGEVVSTSQISPELPEGRSIVAYDVEYINHNQGGPPGEAIDFRDQTESAVQDQMVSSAEQDSGSDPSGGSSGTDDGSGGGGSDGGESSGGSTGESQQNSDQQEGPSQSQSTSSSPDFPLSFAALSTWIPIGSMLLLGAFAIVGFGASIYQEWRRFWDDGLSEPEEWRRIYLAVWLFGLALASGSVAAMLALSNAILVGAFLLDLIGAALVVQAGLWEYREKGGSKYNEYTAALGVGLFPVSVLFMLIQGPSGSLSEMITGIVAFIGGAFVTAIIIYLFAEGLKYILIGTDPEASENADSSNITFAQAGAGLLIGLFVVVAMIVAVIDLILAVVVLLIALLLLALGVLIRLSD